MAFIISVLMEQSMQMSSAVCQETPNNAILRMNANSNDNWLWKDTNGKCGNEKLEIEQKYLPMLLSICIGKKLERGMCFILYFTRFCGIRLMVLF